MSARGVLAALCLVASLAACASTPPATSEPGTGPAATESQPVEGEPGESAAGGTVTGTFDEKIVYPDGVAVEVIRVKHAKLTESGAGGEGQKPGDPVQILSIRVTSGSKAPLDVSAASGTMTYGPDGQEASTVIDDGTSAMSGTVLPGKAKTGSYGYAVPPKYLGDVQLEWSFDFEHGSAIFTGSIK